MPFSIAMLNYQRVCDLTPCSGKKWIRINLHSPSWCWTKRGQLLIFKYLSIRAAPLRRFSESRSSLAGFMFPMLSTSQQIEPSLTFWKICWPLVRWETQVGSHWWHHQIAHQSVVVGLGDMLYPCTGGCCVLTVLMTANSERRSRPVMTGHGVGGSTKTASIRDIFAAFAVCNEFNRSRFAAP